MYYKLYTLDGKFLGESNNVPKNFSGFVEYSGGAIEWFLDGYWHRIGGPAIEETSGHTVWYVFGKYKTKEQHDLLYSIMKLKGLL